MKALARYGIKPGGYRMIDIPIPECGDNDILIEVKAAGICGSDRKHYGIEADVDQFNSVRGHEFSGIIVKTGKNVVDWKVGQRIVSDNTSHVCGTCPSCDAGDFITCPEHVNLGLDRSPYGGFTKYCLIPGEILAIHKHAIWEIPENVSYEEAAIMDPICNVYQAIAQRSSFLPGQDIVIIGAGPLGILAVQIARIMGAVNIVLVGRPGDENLRFPIGRKFGATHTIDSKAEDVVKRCLEICGRDNLGLVVECSGSAIAMQQAIAMLRPNGQIIRVGKSTQHLDFSINDVSSKALSIIGHAGYDSMTWRNALRLLAAGKIDLKSIITHELGLSQWEKGFELMAKKEAIKVILHYDYDDEE